MIAVAADRCKQILGGPYDGLASYGGATNSKVARCVSEGNEASRIVAIPVKPFARHRCDAVVMRTLEFIEPLMRTPLAHAAGYF